MSTVDKALQTQIKNLQARSGRTLQQLFALCRQSSLEKHGQLRDMLKSELGMGHGDANTVVALFLKGGDPGVLQGGDSAAGMAAAPAAGDPLDAIYAGKKAALRPIHDKLMQALSKLGDFEVAPKKAYVSLRRKKQFATLGPATITRFEVGLNMRGVEATDRLQALPAGGMCQYKICLSDPKEVDKELLSWIRQAYDSAG